MTKKDQDIKADELAVAIEREWLADEFIVLLEEKMREENVNRAELARRLKCSQANVTKQFRKGTNLTVRSLVDLALALGQRFVAPKLVPIVASQPPWLAEQTRVLALTTMSWCPTPRFTGVEGTEAASLASPLVTWPDNVTRGEPKEGLFH